MTQDQTVTVRRMLPRDAADVAVLAGELGYPAAESDIERRFEAISRQTDASVFVAQAADGALVGWIHVHALQFLESDPRAEIEGLVVSASARRAGVGRQLVRAAEEWAMNRGLGLIGVRSNQVRSAAKLFYQQMGFEVMKTQTVFRKTLHR